MNKDTSHSDEDIVEKLREGSVDAFDLAYRKYAGKLYAFSIKYLKSKEDAEGLVQSVFLKLWENQASLRKDTSFKSYLFTIAYNEMCSFFRRRKYHQGFVKRTLEENTEISSSYEDNYDYRFVLEQIAQIVAKLPGKQKTVFMKSRYEGKTTKEIAEEMKLSPGTVDNYISESLKFIRNQMKDSSLSVFLFAFLFVF